MTTTSPVAATRVQVNSKAVYARLLANENIVVEHEPTAPTAYFDTEKRRLVLPCWEGMTESLYNMLVGHEVSHAVFSPKGSQWVSDVTAIDPKNAAAVKGFFNVVEDARIERLIKQKYPGLRASFFDGYQTILESDKFGLKGKDISKMSLIDRINLHYKVGVFIDVPFTVEELPLVAKVAGTKTYEDALDLTREIYEFVKSNSQDPQPQPQPQNAEDADEGESVAEGEDSDEQGEGETEGETESPEGEQGDGDGSSKNSGEGEDLEGESRGSGNGPSVDSEAPQPTESGPAAPVTDGVLQNAADQFKEKYPNSGVEYFDLPTFDMKSGIVTAAEVNDDLLKVGAVIDHDLYREFLRKNQSAISTLFQEFERRRAADVQRRTASSDSGSLDANRLWSYRVSEEVFATYQTVRDGQNHGLLFFIDWSGSMSAILKNTVDQAVCLAEFCRKANIPFEIYAFTDRAFGGAASFGSDDEDTTKGPWILNGRNGCYGTNFRLVNFLSSRLKGSQYDSAVKNLLHIANIVGGRGSGRVPSKYFLGGTPLNAATLASLDIIPVFKRGNNLQIVHAIYLTDGGASDSMMGVNKNYDPKGQNWSDRQKFRTIAYGSFFRKNGFQSTASRGGSENLTPVLVNLGRSLCPGTNFIGFDLLSKTEVATRLGHAAQANGLGKGIDYNAITRKVTDEGFGTIANYNGYNQWFGLVATREDHKDHWLVLGAKKITATTVANAMGNELSKVKGNRQFLARFAEIISKEAK